MFDGMVSSYDVRFNGIKLISFVNAVFDEIIYNVNLIRTRECVGTLCK